MLSSYSVYICAFTAILATGAAAQGKLKSTCRQPIVHQNFDVDRILGRWFVYSRHDHDFERGCDCFTSEIAKKEGNSFQISSCCLMSKLNNETLTCDVGVNNLRLANPEKKEAMFLFTRTGVTTESQLWFVDTDYENYLIANACERVSDEEERELFWLVSRTTEVSEATVKKVNSVLKANNFGKEKLIKQRHGIDICKAKHPHRHGNHSKDKIMA